MMLKITKIAVGNMQLKRQKTVFWELDCEFSEFLL